MRTGCIWLLPTLNPNLFISISRQSVLLSVKTRDSDPGPAGVRSFFLYSVSLELRDRQCAV
eukprot:3787028-Prymnesium_polylepis.1